MNIFKLRRQLRRRWKRWRRAIWTISACGLVAIMALLGMPLSDQMERLMTHDSLVVETLGGLRDTNSVTTAPEHSDNWLTSLQEDDQARIVHLKKVYTCGEEQSILGILRADEIHVLLNKHPQYVGQIGADGEVWLEEHISDISDVCRREGYIGIDKNSNLSLFKGPPKDEKVLKTFFQLDVETMESVLPREVIDHLRQGIRIQDVEEYNSVLSTFSDFAIEESEKAMQQSYE